MAEVADLMALWHTLEQQSEQLSSSLQCVQATAFLTDISGQDYARRALTDYWYYGDADGRLTKNYYAHCHVDEQTIKQFDELNRSKASFHQCLLGFSEVERKHISKDIADFHRARGVNAVLHDQSMSRLHVRQAYRQIPVFREPIERITFNWYRSGRSIKKLTKTEVLNKLLEFGAEKEHIKIQIDLLASHSDHQPLAQVQLQAPVLRANIRFASGESKALNNEANQSRFGAREIPKSRFMQELQPPIRRPAARRRPG